MQEIPLDNRAAWLLDKLRSYFLGRAYPALVCLLVLVGHALALELFAILAVLLSASLAVILSDSLKPSVFPILSLVYVISRAHSPGIPSYSDYLASGSRPLLIALCLAVFSASVAFVLVRRVRLFGIRPRGLIALLVLALGLCANGAFSPEWSIGTLLFGLAEAAVYLLAYLIFYVAVADESLEAASANFAYLSALLLILLGGELVALYLGSDSPIAVGGIIKSDIVFGWGIWTSMGAAIAVLIPSLTVGALGSRGRLYFAAAPLALPLIFLTLSRGAALAAVFAYLASLAVAYFHSRRRSFAAAIIIICALGLGVLLLSLDRLPELLDALTFDNGRYLLWRTAANEFLGSPIFGSGFLGLEYPAAEGYFTGVGFMPPMMHSTALELLAASGLVGFLAYVYYRTDTLRPLIIDPHPIRLLVYLSGGVMLVLSLIENYTLQFLPVLHYSLAMAICRLPRGHSFASAAEA